MKQKKKIKCKKYKFYNVTEEKADARKNELVYINILNELFFLQNYIFKKK